MSTYIKRQKLIKVGNSWAVTLDKDFVNQSGIGVVREIAAVYNTDKGVVSLAKSGSSKTLDTERVDSEKQAVMHGKITPELKEWTENFIKENEEALKKLASL